MNDFLRFLQERNSAPRLVSPAPDEAQMAEIYKAAFRAPDHAWLQPWRFINIEGDRRNDYGEALAECLLLRNPAADEAACDKARKSPLRAPLMVVVVACLSDHRKVPHSEQRLSSGCAAQAILLASESLGFAGVWRTGDAAFDRNVMTRLGLSAAEEITAFLYLGTRDGNAKNIPGLNQEKFVSTW